jgi:hypothetical protein
VYRIMKKEILRVQLDLVKAALELLEEIRCGRIIHREEVSKKELSSYFDCIFLYLSKAEFR